jgi:hypothetical protein
LYRRLFRPAKKKPIQRRASLHAEELGPRITPAGLGKGDWVWSLPAAESAAGVSTIQSFLDFEKSKGMQWIAVKAGDGNSTWSQFNTDLVNRAHADGLKVIAWAYVYGGVNNPGQINPSTIAGEIAVAKNALGLVRMASSLTPKGNTSNWAPRLRRMPRPSIARESGPAIRTHSLRIHPSLSSACTRASLMWPSGSIATP